MMSMLSLEIGNVFEGVEFLGAPAEAMRAKPTIAPFSVLFNPYFFHVSYAFLHGFDSYRK